MPLFTVTLSRIILGEQQTWKVYLSLVPIVAGVAIATLTELSFNMIGLISALASTMAFSLQNIYSKKVKLATRFRLIGTITIFRSSVRSSTVSRSTLKVSILHDPYDRTNVVCDSLHFLQVLHDTGVHHLRLLHILGRLALFMFLPIWLVYDLRRLLHDPAVTKPSLETNHYVFGLLFLDGILNWFQNIIAFSVLSIVTPLTYAVASASKRIFVIAITLLVLGNPVTWLNIFGMAMAILGVLCYNKAKFDQRIDKQRETVLPRYYNPTQNGGNGGSFMVNGSAAGRQHQSFAV